MTKYPMTVHGAKLLCEELEKLKKHDRPNVIAAIAEARAHGDLKENAEYHAAREQQGFIEARIADIEGKLSHSQIIDISDMPNNGRVIFGSTVEIFNLEDESTITYQIVGEDEADIKKHKISVSSPVARALVGKEEGDIAVVTTPAGEVEYEISQVKYE